MFCSSISSNCQGTYIVYLHNRNQQKHPKPQLTAFVDISEYIRQQKKKKKPCLVEWVLENRCGYWYHSSIPFKFPRLVDYYLGTLDPQQCCLFQRVSRWSLDHSSKWDWSTGSIISGSLSLTPQTHCGWHRLRDKVKPVYVYICTHTHKNWT